MTKKDRAAIIASVDAERVRITRNGEVHAFGRMPNSIVTGWYFVGFVEHIIDRIKEWSL